MSVYISGDTHGDFQRFSTRNFPQLKEMDRDLNRVIDERFVVQWEQISKIEKGDKTLIITPPAGSAPYADR